MCSIRGRRTRGTMPPVHSGATSSARPGSSTGAARRASPKWSWDKISGTAPWSRRWDPRTLPGALAPVWPADRPHVPIETIRDWFASYVYMPRLRDDATLDRALERLVKDLAEPYVFAAQFDEDTGTYDGAIEGIVCVTDGPGSGLLVRREAVPRTEPEPEENGVDEVEETETDGNEPDEPAKERTEASPTRFLPVSRSSRTAPDSWSPGSWTRSSSNLPAHRAPTSA